VKKKKTGDSFSLVDSYKTMERPRGKKQKPGTGSSFGSSRVFGQRRDGRELNCAKQINHEHWKGSKAVIILGGGSRGPSWFRKLMAKKI